MQKIFIVRVNFSYLLVGFSLLINAIGEKIMRRKMIFFMPIPSRSKIKKELRIRQPN